MLTIRVDGPGRDTALTGGGNESFRLCLGTQAVTAEPPKASGPWDQ